MTRTGNPLDLETVLREHLAERARVSDDELVAVRASIGRLPARRRRIARPLLAAAVVILAVGLGGLAISRLPIGLSGAPSGPPDPAAFAGDPRIAACGVESLDELRYVFEMEHLRDFPRHFPAAGRLDAFGRVLEEPVLVVVFAGRRPGEDRPGAPAGATLAPGHHDVCLVQDEVEPGDGPSFVPDVDVTGFVAVLPPPAPVRPAGSPVPPDPAAFRGDPRLETCAGGEEAWYAFELAAARDYRIHLPAMSRQPDLEVDDPAFVVAFAGPHPFPPRATPPAPGATVAPRPPLVVGHRDVCVLVEGRPDPLVVEDVPIVGFFGATGLTCASWEAMSALDRLVVLDRAAGTSEYWLARIRIEQALEPTASRAEVRDAIAASFEKNCLLRWDRSLAELFASLYFGYRR